MENISGEIASFRDTILEKEKNRLEELKKDKRTQNAIDQLSIENLNELYEFAKQKYAAIQSGKLSPKEVDRETNTLVIMVAAIDDYIQKHEKNDYDYNLSLIDEDTYGREI